MEIGSHGVRWSTTSNSTGTGTETGIETGTETGIETGTGTETGIETGTETGMVAAREGPGMQRTIRGGGAVAVPRACRAGALSCRKHGALWLE
ncbi:hypothetical protein FHG87_016702 [Trinorchestia longiramus]|nr:hypothetical protein FHG87_016702 [Trinorchestia longiramus]